MGVKLYIYNLQLTVLSTLCILQCQIKLFQCSYSNHIEDISDYGLNYLTEQLCEQLDSDRQTGSSKVDMLSNLLQEDSQHNKFYSTEGSYVNQPISLTSEQTSKKCLQYIEYSDDIAALFSSNPEIYKTLFPICCKFEKGNKNTAVKNGQFLQSEKVTSKVQHHISSSSNTPSQPSSPLTYSQPLSPLTIYRPFNDSNNVYSKLEYNIYQHVTKEAVFNLIIHVTCDKHEEKNDLVSDFSHLTTPMGLKKVVSKSLTNTHNHNSILSGEENIERFHLEKYNDQAIAYTKFDNPDTSERNSEGRGIDSGTETLKTSTKQKRYKDKMRCELSEKLELPHPLQPKDIIEPTMPLIKPALLRALPNVLCKLTTKKPNGTKFSIKPAKQKEFDIHRVSTDPGASTQNIEAQTGIGNVNMNQKNVDVLTKQVSEITVSRFSSVVIQTENTDVDFTNSYFTSKNESLSKSYKSEHTIELHKDIKNMIAQAKTSPRLENILKVYQSKTDTEPTKIKNDCVECTTPLIAENRTKELSFSVGPPINLINHITNIDSIKTNSLLMTENKTYSLSSQLPGKSQLSSLQFKHENALDSVTLPLLSFSQRKYTANSPRVESIMIPEEYKGNEIKVTAITSENKNNSDETKHSGVINTTIFKILNITNATNLWEMLTTKHTHSFVSGNNRPKYQDEKTENPLNSLHHYSYQMAYRKNVSDTIIQNKSNVATLYKSSEKSSSIRLDKTIIDSGNKETNSNLPISSFYNNQTDNTNKYTTVQSINQNEIKNSNLNESYKYISSMNHNKSKESALLVNSNDSAKATQDQFKYDNITEIAHFGGGMFLFCLRNKWFVTNKNHIWVVDKDMNNLLNSSLFEVCRRKNGAEYKMNKKYSYFTNSTMLNEMRKINIKELKQMNITYLNTTGEIPFLLLARVILLASQNTSSNISYHWSGIKISVNDLIAMLSISNINLISNSHEGMNLWESNHWKNIFSIIKQSPEKISQDRIVFEIMNENGTTDTLVVYNNGSSSWKMHSVNIIDLMNEISSLIIDFESSGKISSHSYKSTQSESFLYFIGRVINETIRTNFSFENQYRWGNKDFYLDEVLTLIRILNLSDGDFNKEGLNESLQKNITSILHTFNKQYFPNKIVYTKITHSRTERIVIYLNGTTDFDGTIMDFKDSLQTVNEIKNSSIFTTRVNENRDENYPRYVIRLTERKHMFLFNGEWLVTDGRRVWRFENQTNVSLNKSILNYNLQNVNQTLSKGLFNRIVKDKQSIEPDYTMPFEIFSQCTLLTDHRVSSQNLSFYWKQYPLTYDDIIAVLRLGIDTNNNKDLQSVWGRIKWEEYCNNVTKANKSNANNTKSYYIKTQSGHSSLLTVHINGSSIWENRSMEVNDLLILVRGLNSKFDVTETTENNEIRFQINKNSSYKPTSLFNRENHQMKSLKVETIHNYEWNKFNDTTVKNPINVGGKIVNFNVSGWWYLTNGIHIWGFDRISTNDEISKAVSELKVYFAQRRKLKLKDIQFLVNSYIDKASKNDFSVKTSMPFELLAQYSLFIVDSEKQNKPFNVHYPYKQNVLTVFETTALLRMSSYNIKIDDLSWGSWRRINWDWLLDILVNKAEKIDHMNDQFMKYKFNVAPFNATSPLLIYYNYTSEWTNEYIHSYDLFRKLEHLNVDLFNGPVEIDVEQTYSGSFYAFYSNVIKQRRNDKIYKKYIWETYNASYEFSWHDIIVHLRCSELMLPRRKTNDNYWVSIIEAIRKSSKTDYMDKIEYKINYARSSNEDITIFMNESSVVKGNLVLNISSYVDSF